MNSPVWLLQALGLLLGLSLPTALVAQQGSVSRTHIAPQAFLLSLPVPGSSAPEYFRAPSGADRLQFRQAMSDLWNNRPEDAALKAATIGYLVTELAESTGPGRILVLHESHQPGEAGYQALGYYAVRQPARPRLVIEVPHPRHDLHTREEGIQAFFTTDAAALFVAGIHRDNSSGSSPCTDGSYRISDAAHWDKHFFHEAHRTVVDLEPKAIAIQLHGYGSPQNEQFILSEGVATDPSTQHFVRRLEHYLEQQELYVALVYPTETTKLGGTWNTQGRYTNGVKLDPCQNAATHASGTFVHIEQVLSIRQDPQGFLRALDAVVSEFWPQ